MKPTTEQIERELRTEREAPNAEFARALDEWAEAGFPRGEGPHAGRRRGGWLRQLWEQVAAVPPRRIVAPVGAAATLAIVASVAVVQSGGIGESGGGSSDPVTAPATDAPAAGIPQSPGESEYSFGLPRGPESRYEFRAPGDEARRPPLKVPPRDELVPLVPEAATSDPIIHGRAKSSTIAPPPGPGPEIAGGRSERVVERSASLTIGAEPGDVPDVADGVISVAKANGGIVVSSQVTTGEDDAHATFDLAIPIDRLQGALTALSELSHVVSLNEGSLDITGPAVSARRRLERAESRLESLQARLADALAAADDDAERRIRLRIREAQFQADAARREIRGLKGRAQFARVSVTITSEGQTTNGEWSLGDALDDAARVLVIVAGVALISAAILLPVALVAALAALAWRGTARRRRERALED